jgi:hypothetical protein
MGRAGYGMVWVWAGLGRDGLGISRVLVGHVLAWERFGNGQAWILTGLGIFWSLAELGVGWSSARFVMFCAGHVLG